MCAGTRMRFSVSFTITGLWSAKQIHCGWICPRFFSHLCGHQSQQTLSIYIIPWVQDQHFYGWPTVTVDSWPGIATANHRWCHVSADPVDCLMFVSVTGAGLCSLCTGQPPGAVGTGTVLAFCRPMFTTFAFPQQIWFCIILCCPRLGEC